MSLRVCKRGLGCEPASVSEPTGLRASLPAASVSGPASCESTEATRSRRALLGSFLPPLLLRGRPRSPRARVGLRAVCCLHCSLRACGCGARGRGRSPCLGAHEQDLPRTASLPAESVSARELLAMERRRRRRAHAAPACSTCRPVVSWPPATTPAGQHSGQKQEAAQHGTGTINRSLTRGLRLRDYGEAATHDQAQCGCMSRRQTWPAWSAESRRSPLPPLRSSSIEEEGNGARLQGTRACWIHVAPAPAPGRYSLLQWLHRVVNALETGRKQSRAKRRWKRAGIRWERDGNRTVERPAPCPSLIERRRSADPPRLPHGNAPSRCRRSERFTQDGTVAQCAELRCQLASAPAAHTTVPAYRHGGSALQALQQAWRPARVGSMNVRSNCQATHDVGPGRLARPRHGMPSLVSSRLGGADVRCLCPITSGEQTTGHGHASCASCTGVRCGI